MSTATSAVNSYCYAFVVWGDVKYLVGALAAAHSLRMCGTAYDVVLIHGYDNTLLPKEVEESKLFTRVVSVVVRRDRVRELRTARQRELYGGEFSATANTKWEVLQLTQYEKVCYLDCDLIFQQCPDEIFELRPPAACFSNPYAQPFNARGPRNCYGAELQHGVSIPPAQILQSLHQDGFVASGAVVLLSPQMGTAKALATFIQAHSPYGHARSYSAIDEQCLCEFYAQSNIAWTHMHQRYQIIPWKLNWLHQNAQLSDPIGLHFYHDKPWQKGQGENWPDVQLWWNKYHSFEAQYNTLAAVIRPLIEHYSAPKAM